MDDEVRRCKDDLKVIYLGDLMDGAHNHDSDHRDKEGLMRKTINLCWGCTECEMPMGFLSVYDVDIAVQSTMENQGLG